VSLGLGGEMVARQPAINNQNVRLWLDFRTVLIHTKSPSCANKRSPDQTIFLISLGIKASIRSLSLHSQICL